MKDLILKYKVSIVIFIISTIIFAAIYICTKNSLLKLASVIAYSIITSMSVKTKVHKLPK
jgi:hypothetical protein